MTQTVDSHQLSIYWCCYIGLIYIWQTQRVSANVLCKFNYMAVSLSRYQCDWNTSERFYRLFKDVNLTMTCNYLPQRSLNGDADPTLYLVEVSVVLLDISFLGSLVQECTLYCSVNNGFQNTLHQSGFYGVGVWEPSGSVSVFARLLLRKRFKDRQKKEQGGGMKVNETEGSERTLRGRD